MKAAAAVATAAKAIAMVAEACTFTLEETAARLDPSLRQSARAVLDQTMLDLVPPYKRARTAEPADVDKAKLTGNKPVG